MPSHSPRAAPHRRTSCRAMLIACGLVLGVARDVSRTAGSSICRPRRHGARVLPPVARFPPSWAARRARLSSRATPTSSLQDGACSCTHARGVWAQKRQGAARGGSRRREPRAFGTAAQGLRASPSAGSLRASGITPRARPRHACLRCGSSNAAGCRISLSRRSELNVPAEAVQALRTTASGNVPAMAGLAARQISSARRAACTLQDATRCDVHACGAMIRVRCQIASGGSGRREPRVFGAAPQGLSVPAIAGKLRASGNAPRARTRHAMVRCVN